MDLINLIINEDPNDGSGVSAIALVDAPAIESGFHAFNSQKLVKHTIFLGTNKGNYTPIEGDKQILAGALMIPDIEIYRKEGEKEFNVSFTSETIKQIQEKFALRNANTAINQMHNNDTPVNGGLIQHFIIDRKTGVMPPFKSDLPDGTWYGYIKVNDKAVWDNFIKTGIYTGFSVEGNFYEQPSDSFLADLEKVLNK